MTYRLLNVYVTELVEFSTFLTRRYSSKMSKRHQKDDYRRQRKRREQTAITNKKLPYLTPSDDGFEKLVKEKYSDFVHLPHSNFPQELEQDVAWAFNKLESEGYFYRDWVHVRGKLVLTPISRTLVGAPGTTYKYLGLRLFTLPWEFESGKDLSEIEQACSIIGRLNGHFKMASHQLLNDRQEMKSLKDGDAGLTGSKVSPDADQLQSHVAESGKMQESDIPPRTGSWQSDQSYQESTENYQSMHRKKESSGSSGAANISTKKDGSDAANQHSVPRKEFHRSDHQGLSAGEYRQPSDSIEQKLCEDTTRVTDVDHHPHHHYNRPEVRAKTIEEGTDYTVALINYMDPLDPELYLKPEPYYGMGPLAVSWHMDGNLVRGSTVAVYSYICETADGSSLRDWTIGVKVSWDSETPGLAVPLASGDSYFMLADLNDTHQHCVIAGDQPRFSSTHRVVESSRGTLSYIQGRCRTAVENLMPRKDCTAGEDSQNMPSLKTLESRTIKFTEEVHNEVEFEWLRQFWMQGSRHAAERTFWIQPMEDLEHMWESMELMSKLAIDAALSENSPGDQAQTIITDLLPFLETREKLRCEWTNRFGSNLILSMEPDMIPLYRPSWDDMDPIRPLPFTLTKVIRQLKSRWEELQSSSC